MEPIWRWQPADTISLRDYFAAKAMQGWLSSFGPGDAVKPEGVANLAYRVADAMIAARTQEPPK